MADHRRLSFACSKFLQHCTGRTISHSYHRVALMMMLAIVIFMITIDAEYGNDDHKLMLMLLLMIHAIGGLKFNCAGE